MANLKDVIYLSAEDYNTLYTNGTVTINGVTLTYDANNIYIVPDDTQEQIDDILALIPSSATTSNKLATASDIPTVPTNISAFNNDAGYLTSHQDISGKRNNPTTATTFSGSVVENTNYILSTAISSLTISSIANSGLESNIIFEVTGNSFSITFPANTPMIGEEPTYESGEKYIVSICNGIVIVAPITV